MPPCFPEFNIAVHPCPYSVSHFCHNKGRNRSSAGLVSSSKFKTLPRNRLSSSEYFAADFCTRGTHVEAGAGRPDVAVVPGDHRVLDHVRRDQLVVDIALKVQDEVVQNHQDLISIHICILFCHHFKAWRGGTNLASYSSPFLSTPPRVSPASSWWCVGDRRRCRKDSWKFSRDSSGSRLVRRQHVTGWWTPGKGCCRRPHYFPRAPSARPPYMEIKAFRGSCSETGNLFHQAHRSD